MLKHDWDQSKKRFAAWWHREVEDRVLLQVLAPRKDVKNVYWQIDPTTMEDIWLDVDLRIARFEYQMAHTYYGGDAFAYLDTHIGPGTMSLYMG